MARKTKSNGGRGGGNAKTLIIAILSVLVLIESYVLFIKKPEGRGKPTIKKPAVAQTVKREPVPVSPAPEARPPKKYIPPPQPPPEKYAPSPTPIARGNGAKITIIIDDCGYNKSHCDLLEEITSPVTVSVLPNLPHSADIAICAHRQKKEVMLHLPLEAHKNFEEYPEDYFIKTSMKRAQVETLVDQAIANIPYVEGVNNHTGSKATENERIMSIIFAKLKDKGLFFVDSFVTGKSICRSLARKMRLDFAQRDIFLDNTNERYYIEDQFRQLAQKAREHGYAIAIGHDRELTLQIIKEQTVLLKKLGYDIVPARELIRKTK